MKPKRELDSSTAAPAFFSPQVASARRFYLDLTPPKQTALSIVCGGREHCTPDYAVRRLDFPYYSIEFVAQGRGWLQCAGKPQELRLGKLFAYGPGVPHEITTEGREPMVKYFVDFVGRDARALLESCALRLGRCVQTYAPGEIQQVLDDLICSGLSGSRHAPAICAKLLELLALKLADTAVATGLNPSQAFATYQNCRRYLHENFRALRTLEQAATECHVNVAHLCRLFQRFDHQSPYQFLLRLKMNAAAEQLQTSNDLVKQVGESIGYGDPFHFSRAFKRVLGVSPEAFRKLR